MLIFVTFTHLNTATGWIEAGEPKKIENIVVGAPDCIVFQNCKEEQKIGLQIVDVVV